MSLAPADRTKLARVLALLGSDQPGEVAAAARAADRLVRGRGLSWSDVLQQPSTPLLSPRSSRHEDPAAVDLRTCGQRPDLLTAWECAFVADLAKVASRRFSARQRAILADVAAKVRAAGPRAR